MMNHKIKYKVNKIKKSNKIVINKLMKRIKKFQILLKILFNQKQNQKIINSLISQNKLNKYS